MAKKILVVDDTRLILHLTKMSLEKAGYEVIVAASGPEGLALVKKERPGLVILDIMMPDMDGFEVCRRLKADEETSSIPVIFLTAKGQEADRNRGLGVGAIDFITKPFSPRKLVEKVKQYSV